MYLSNTEKLRRIANHSYEIRKRCDSSQQEEYDSIISNSLKYFEQTFPTAPMISQQYQNKRVYQKKSQNLKNYSLDKAMNHYSKKFDQMFPKITTKTKQIKSFSISKRRNLNDDNCVKIEQSCNTIDSKPQQMHPLFNKTLQLIIIDLLEQNKFKKAIIGVNIGIYHRSSFKKCIFSFFDDEIYNLILKLYPQNEIPIPENVVNICETVRTKEDFFKVFNLIKDSKQLIQAFVQYFFIPQKIYRQQLILDLIEHINKLLVELYKNQEVKISKLCHLNGVPIDDFIQITWDTNYLISYSSDETVINQLALVEQLITRAKDKLKIDYINKKQSVNLKTSFRNVVNFAVTNDKPINIFLKKLKIPLKDENDKKQENKIGGVMNQIMSVIRGKNQLEMNKIYFLTPLEIQIILKEHNNLNTEMIINYFNDFKSIIFQNDIFELKNSLLDKSLKIEDKNRNKQAYLHLIYQQCPQLNRHNINRICIALNIKLQSEIIYTPLDWSQYLLFRLLLDGRCNDKQLSIFLRNYFDQENKRWLDIKELRQILQEIVQNYPQTFQFMFLSIIKNWFKDMNFVQEDKFDSGQFTSAIETNSQILKYIVQWIIGDYDKVQKSN